MQGNKLTMVLCLYGRLRCANRPYGPISPSPIDGDYRRALFIFTLVRYKWAVVEYFYVVDNEINYGWYNLYGRSRFVNRPYDPILIFMKSLSHLQEDLLLVFLFAYGTQS